MGEGGQGGILRIDFSSDGKRVRAEALGAGATSLADSTTISTILFSAESGDVCDDQKVSGVFVCVLVSFLEEACCVRKARRTIFQMPT